MLHENAMAPGITRGVCWLLKSSATCLFFFPATDCTLMATTTFWNGMKSNCFSIPLRLFLSCSHCFSHIVFWPLLTEQATVDRPRAIKLCEAKDGVLLSATTANVVLSPEDLQSFLYRAGSLLLGSGHSSSVKKRKPSSTTVTIRRQSKKVTRNSIDKVIKAAAESVTKMETVIRLTSAASDAIQPEAESALEVLKVATKEYCFVRYTSFLS